MNRLSPLLAVLALLPPLSLSGQDSTGAPTPFRKGQWAAQFQAGTAFGSLGFIKFRSPTRALVLDLRISGSHSETMVTDSSGTRFGDLHSTAFTEVRFGWRRYSGDGTAAKVVSHYSFGALAGFQHDVAAAPGGSSQTNGWTAGVFGDVGGTYLLTSRFGIGALATATIYYRTAVSKSSFGFASRDWTIGGSALSAALVATVYF
ncbi:MAG TPA: hypothetical protein VMR92_05950 [Gemmatimonadales bacterium]|jgi:hypothetical protein|nr:hypothetical protein [Gemmatimonadales bacterium]